MKRAWVIGNGESLRETPLEEIREDTFGCNRIHLVYPFRKFRPVYYVRFEPPTWIGTSEEFYKECKLHLALGEQCIFPSAWWEQLGDWPNIEYRNSCHHFKYHHESRKFPHAWHLPLVCDVNAVTTMMQMAVLKGYEEIVLVGCDLTGAHVSKDDNGKVETERLKRVHEIAFRSCPIPVYNATIGGALEIYPRVKIKDLL